MAPMRVAGTRKAIACMESGQTAVLEIDLDDEVLGAGMPCGGHMRVYIEPVLPRPSSDPGYRRSSRRHAPLDLAGCGFGHHIVREGFVIFFTFIRGRWCRR